MSIALFQHNQTAYEAVCILLEKTGRAAVIHPTGTGKSFIAFRLCEDNPDQTIVWLSPSRYIFETQLENLQKAGGNIPENIRFFTYARLMFMSREEVAELHPDCIILDEFHRCGAEMWGRGVDTLLKAYPKVPVLGLSATNIRYLDNQRDMAEELFNGNIASEMSLGEAIVRGILNPPKYVLSVFSYQKELAKYEKRVRQSGNQAVRRAGEEYLEALRRALDRADGLDVIFQKHMTDRTGRYIAFCSNVDHLYQMMKLAPKWFAGVDPCAHFYTAYSDNSETDLAFQNFKKDNSAHLKILFCVDMLNEGIHVEDISGVILLRPTVSPIIYKQQIGRALSASQKKNSVIFDIVLNIENLYSIGAVEEEMQLALTYYREQGLQDEIVNDHFQVIDEVRDCAELFRKLNDTLSPSWEEVYCLAGQYAEEHGNLDVPVRYLTEDGYTLGLWIKTQRAVHAGKIPGILTEEQKSRLESIGMRWESVRDEAWDKYYAAAEACYNESGGLPLTVSDRKYHGIGLERWLGRLRDYRKNDIQPDYLTEERIADLDRIGMVWDVPNYLWEQNYHAALDYYRENGNLKVPRSYISADGIRLGGWIASVRRAVRDGRNMLSGEQLQKLEKLGIDWGKKQMTWQEAYQAVLEYKEEQGNLKLPRHYKTESGYDLGQWLIRQKAACRIDFPERRKLLEELGLQFDEPDGWNEKFELLKQYYQDSGAENQPVRIPVDYIVQGVWLGRWLAEQKARLNGRRGKDRELTEEQIRKLGSVGIYQCSSGADRLWEKRYEAAAAYFRENGNLDLSRKYRTPEGEPLGSWLQSQRNSRNSGGLSDEKIRQLDEIGMIWNPEETIWNRNYEKVRAYYDRSGNLELPVELKSETGGSLSVWLDRQRSSYADGKLGKEQVKKLEAMGMDWRPLSEIRWEQHYLEAKEYFDAHCNLDISSSYRSPGGFALGAWVKRQQKNRSDLDAARIRLLDEIGMTW